MPLAGRGAGSESFSEVSRQQEEPDTRTCRDGLRRPGPTCPHSRRRRSRCSTNTFGGVRLGRKQGR